MNPNPVPPESATTEESQRSGHNGSHSSSAGTKKSEGSVLEAQASSDSNQQSLNTLVEQAIDNSSGATSQPAGEKSSHNENELLMKAQEAMIAAVHTFNGVGLNFRAELFVVTSIIGWTYLLHSWFRKQGIDYRYRASSGQVIKTKNGADRYWELGRCLSDENCPLPRGVIKNLEFLIELRHEIEHRLTNRIDDAVSAKLQACCINFNDSIKNLFGDQYGLERRLPIALQFVTFGSDQRTLLKGASLPANITSMIDAFEHGLSEVEYMDRAYRYRVAFVPLVHNRVSTSDVAIEFVKHESMEGKEAMQVLLKEVERKRYTASQVWALMQNEGFHKFNQTAHTNLWKKLGAKDRSKGFGRPGDYKGTWVWYPSWLERVREHCRTHKSRYQ